MKLSDYIKKLQAALAQYGDLEVEECGTPIRPEPRTKAPVVLYPDAA